MIFKPNPVWILGICLVILLGYRGTVCSSQCYTPKQDNIPYYSGPGENHQQIGVLAKGRVINAIGIEGAWLKFKENGKTVYILLAPLKASDCQSPAWQGRSGFPPLGGRFNPSGARQ